MKVRLAFWCSFDDDAEQELHLPRRAWNALLGHPAGGDWVVEAVSMWVNKADHDPQRIASETPEPAPKQGRLFD